MSHAQISLGVAVLMPLVATRQVAAIASNADCTNTAMAM